ncbi:MAG: DUF1302 family protein, partial [Candidatus Binataceae bacterium]
MFIGTSQGRPLRGVLKLSSMATIVAVVIVYGAIAAFAGGETIMGDTLNITATPTQSLMQSAGAGMGTSAGSSTAENAWLSDLHMSGFLNQTFGMWQNPSALRDFTSSRNNLATSRTWLQVDTNYQLNNENRFFLRTWFIYEPPYAFNSANNDVYAAGSAPPGGAGPASYGHFMNDFYNQYTVRDAWWETTHGPLSVYVGNQIVVWGQSIAFRVGDVINPQDTTWAFGFSNLEQSRIPQWMIHPILNLPDFAGTFSNFIEAVIIPRYQPEWSWDYADGRYFNESGVSGSVNQGFPAAMHGPSARFDVHYVNKYYPGRTVALTSIHGPFGPQAAGLVTPPFSHEFYWCSDLQAAAAPGSFNPVKPGAQRACPFTHDGTVKFGPLGSGATVDIGQWKVPAATLANWEEGVRYHTLIGNTEATIFYFNTWDYYPAFYWQPFSNQWRARFAPEQFVGVTADRPLPMPTSLAEFFPLVSRAEVVYSNHQPYMDMNPFNQTAVRYSDTLDMMYAVDLDQAYAPWLTSTGNLTANIEAQDYITLDSNASMLTAGSPWGGVGGALTESVNKNEVNVLLNIGSSWYWSAFAPTWTMIFNPKGRNFLMFPSVLLTPPWTKKYFLKLQAIEVLGGDNQSIGGGLFKGESFLTAQLQYNFN